MNEKLKKKKSTLSKKGDGEAALESQQHKCAHQKLSQPESDRSIHETA